MKTLARISLLLVLISLLTAACGPRAVATEAPLVGLPGQSAESLPPAATAMAPMASAPESKAASDNSSPAGGMPASDAVVQTGADALTGAQAGRMILKNAEVRLLVAETDTAIDRALQTVSDVGGYIISSRVWYQPVGEINYKYATLTIGVPSDQFEPAMRRFRTMALKVLDETASGQDVTDEFVDLQSQLTNLEATRDRIRSFLADAKTVEESLRINQELTNIEAQIEQVKGRMNYLSNRAAYSTITLTLEPDIPPATATPTPTPIPTETWNPGKTFDSASNAIVIIYQKIIELLIWVLIVLLPLILPPALILWIIFKLFTRKSPKA